MTETMKAKSSYTIGEIIDLVKNGLIELPPIQRDFVWSPKKIEDLWDSLLRGFPIGCFICKINNDKIEILDGQQRLTSILLGMDWSDYKQENNAYLNNIKSLQEKVKIFTDLQKYPLSTHYFKIYNTRVITVSHPWGYQRKRNDKILEYANIDKAKDNILKLSDIKKHKTDYWDNPEFFANSFPYDCGETVKMTDLMPRVKEVILKYPGKDAENNIIQPITDNDRKKIQNYGVDILKLSIPFIYVCDSEEMQNSSEVSDEKDDEILDPTEYLFTLINTAGQRISNDDLNYSLVKSALMTKEGEDNGRKTIDAIAVACKKSHISPSRFMMICYFLWRKDAGSLDISTRRFRTGLMTGQQEREDRKDFISFLKEFYDEDGVRFIKRAEELMVYDGKNKKGIPYIMFLDIISQNMYLTYLMSYLVEHEEDFKNVKKYIISLINLLYVFGYKTRQRNTMRILVQEFVKILKEQKNGDLGKTIRQFMGNHRKDIDYVPLKPNRYKRESEFEAYIKGKRALLLFAQREFLNDTFKKGQFTLDDMNRPFDYDHIFPSKERGRYNCKNWDTIGNFRAWPYDQNRSDQADAPVVKFKNNGKFVDKLLQNSFCFDKKRPNYFKIHFNKIGEDVRKNRKMAEDVITERIRLIYEEWYDTLKIDDLMNG